jgi:hypothetical protein
MTYPVGSFFLTTVPGWGGYLISLGQALAGDPSRWEHAGIVIDADGTVVEAEPGGARIGHLSAYAGQPLLVCDGPVQEALASESPRAGLREVVVREARALIGTPYSALDYAALGLLHLHLPSTWVRRRVETSGHLICSALVDRAMCRAGIHLFSDGRYPGDVLPADLAAWAEDWSARQ